MDAKTVRDKIIRPKLEEVFGNVLTNLILTRSITAAMKGGTEPEKFKLMVESICSDPKVVSMWGAAQIQTYKHEWMALLK